MNDLISRSALLAEYDRVHVGPPGGARKLIAEAPAIATDNNVGGKWIPVTERLPIEDTRVLVWLVDGAHEYARMDTDRRHNNKWVRWERYVTHWMPLPEPPKEC